MREKMHDEMGHNKKVQFIQQNRLLFLLFLKLEINLTDNENVASLCRHNKYNTDHCFIKYSYWTLFVTAKIESHKKQQKYAVIHSFIWF